MHVCVIDFVFFYARKPLQEPCVRALVRACDRKGSGGLRLGGVSCGEVMGETRGTLIISTLKTHFNYNLQPADKGCSHRSNP